MIHLLGEPTETRHLMIADRHAVISPSWSLHSGVGTAAYSFVWAMAGENQSFDDMDPRTGHRAALTPVGLVDVPAAPGDGGVGRGT